MVPKCTRILGLFFIVIFLFAAMAFSEKVETIKLVVGKSRLIDSPVPVKRVSVGNPDIADVVVISPKQVHVNAKAPGVTNVILWREDGACKFYDLQVFADITQLKQKLNEVLPDEDIKVNAAQDSIILSGEVSSTVNLSIAVELAKPFASEGKVVNLMQVGGVQQVMIEVRVAEMGSHLMRRLGFNFSYFSGPDFGISLLRGLTRISEITAEGISAISATSPVNALFRFHHGRSSWTGFIDALKEEGIVKILAEPTLIAMSGQGAQFFAGGEFPVPVPQPGAGSAMVTIEWKKYGVELGFTPRVLSDNKISITVTPVVSELDYQNAVYMEGWRVPAVTERSASTTIELDDGQSFAIAGLLKEDVYQIINKFPVLGDIPILGALFRSSEFKRRESELVIIVTPHLVRPLDMARQTLPTDYYVEPDDFEFYLLGMMEGIEKKRCFMPREKMLEGGFGHILP